MSPVRPLVARHANTMDRSEGASVKNYLENKTGGLTG